MEPEPQRRGAKVVDAILDAAMHELARVGFAGLSIEDGAARAGVNKTTVYRRWPTKRELVVAALTNAAIREEAMPNSGDVRRDLFEFMRGIRDVLSSPVGRSTYLALLADEPVIAGVAAEVRTRGEARMRMVIGRAIERGELPRDLDLELVGELIFGALQVRLLFKRDATVNDDYLHKVIDFVVAGAEARTNS